MSGSRIGRGADAGNGREQKQGRAEPPVEDLASAVPGSAPNPIVAAAGPDAAVQPAAAPIVAGAGPVAAAQPAAAGAAPQPLNNSDYDRLMDAIKETLIDQDGRSNTIEEAISKHIPNPGSLAVDDQARLVKELCLFFANWALQEAVEKSTKNTGTDAIDITTQQYTQAHQALADMLHPDKTRPPLTLKELYTHISSLITQENDITFDTGQAAVEIDMDHLHRSQTPLRKNQDIVNLLNEQRRLYRAALSTKAEAIQATLAQKMGALRPPIIGFSQALIKSILTTENLTSVIEDKDYPKNFEFEEQLFNAITNNNRSVTTRIIAGPMFSENGIDDATLELRQAYLALKELQQILHSDYEIEFYDQLVHAQQPTLPPLPELDEVSVRQDLYLQFLDAQKKLNADLSIRFRETLKTILESDQQLQSGRPPISSLSKLISDETLKALETSRQRARCDAIRKVVNTYQADYETIEEYLRHDLLDHNDLDLRLAAAEKLKADLDALNTADLNSRTLENDINTINHDITSLRSKTERHVAQLKRLKTSFSNYQTLIDDNLNPKFDRHDDTTTTKNKLEKALAYIPHAQHCLREVGPDRIRFHGIAKDIQDRITALQKQQKEWNETYQNQQRRLRAGEALTKEIIEPLHIGTSASEMPDVRSIDPSTLESRAKHYDSNTLERSLRTLLDIYRANWETLRRAKQAPRLANGEQTSELKALGNLLKTDANNPSDKDAIQKIIHSIQSRLDNKDTGGYITRESLTFGRPAPGNHYKARKPENQPEVDYLVMMLKHFTELHEEMLEIYQAESRKQLATYTISPFGGQAHTTYKKAEFDAFVQDLFTHTKAAAPSSNPGGLLTSSSSSLTNQLFRETLAKENKTIPEQFTIYIKDNEPTIPVMYSREIRKGGLKRVQDGILSIDPSLSDHYLIAEILNTKYPRNHSEKQWLDVIQEGGTLPYSIDSAASMNQLVQKLIVSGFLPTDVMTSDDNMAKLTKYLVEKLDKARYTQEGMPKQEYVDIAARFIAYKYRQVLDGRCPSPVNISGESKPLVQAMELIIKQSPKMSAVFKLPPNNPFKVSSRQLSLAKKDHNYRPSDKATEAAEKLTTKSEIDALPSRIPRSIRKLL